MDTLAGFLPPEQLNRVGFRLYEKHILGILAIFSQK
jgi:hypothetical protein